MIDVPALLQSAPAADPDARKAVADRAGSVLRPPGALARLDEIAVWLAGWQRSATPAVRNPRVILFAADHGVVSEGVSAFPAAVTTAMLAALGDGVATVSAMAAALDIPLHVIDAGVGQPTGNLRHEDALTEDRFDAAFALGRAAVRENDADLLVFGELGIGNTTAAAAVSACLHRGDAAQWTGPGTGVTGERLRNKIAVVSDARARVPAGTPPLEILRRVGGAELVAIAGAIVEARLASIPVLLDGYVVTAAAAPLESAFPTALAHCLAGHRSPEPGHGRLLEILNMDPLLDLEMRLGEGTGALAAVPLVRLAAAAVVNVATFEEFGLA